MKTQQLLPLLALVAGLALPVIASAHDHAKSADKPAAPSDLSAVASAKEGRLDEPTDKDAAWLDRARKDYPLKTCVISADSLGSMGETTDLIYRQENQPDRLVRFCCESCIKDFKKDPAKYLKVIDAAAKPAATTYVCPMHADVTSAKAGDKCSKCGMALVPAKPADARHHH